MFVIMREEDGAYVTPPGSRWSYTVELEKAQKFHSRDRAAAECQDNEVVVPIGDETI